MWQELYMHRAGMQTLMHPGMHIDLDVIECSKFYDLIETWNGLTIS
jgi:hypothetical protein